MCSDHFVKGKPSTINLDPDYVPSIFPTGHVKAKTKADSARAARLINRRHSAPQVSQLFESRRTDRSVRGSQAITKSAASSAGATATTSTESATIFTEEVSIEDDVDNDAGLRNAIKDAPTYLLISVLPEELTDDQLEEIMANRRKKG